MIRRSLCRWVLARTVAGVAALAMVGVTAAAADGTAAAIAGSAARGPVLSVGHRQATALGGPAGVVHRLPEAAVGPVSRMLGRDQPGYRIVPSGQGYLARNAPQRLTAWFSGAGVRVRSGALSFGIRARAFGYGARLRRLPVIHPTARANQVRYQASGLAAWYVNGPLGIEQGFTLPAPPAARSRGRLSIVLAVTGHARVRRSAAGLSFTAGTSALSYQGLVVTDARGRRLPAGASLAGREFTIRADVRGAVFPVTVDPELGQAKLTASDGAGNDIFGTAVAVQGGTIVVTAPNAQIGSTPQQGAAYVFTEPAQGWTDMTQCAKLTASDGIEADDYGNSVSLDGETIVVGAPNQTVNGHSDQGAAYVYSEPAGGWSGALTQSAELTAPDGADGNLGIAAVVSGTTIVAGASGTTVGPNAGQGAAYVYTEPGGGWSGSLTDSAELTASGGAAGDELGSAVALAGSVVAVGAQDAMVGSNPDQGAAYVYSEPGGGWSGALTQSAELTAPGGGADDTLGGSVAADGGAVFAAATGATVGANASQGAVYVFTEPGGGWSGSLTPAAELTASDGAALDYLGTSLAVSGDTVLAGAQGHGNSAGALYVFTEPSGGWSSETQTSEFTASDGAAGDELGYAAAAGGDTLVGGAPNAQVGASADQGAVYVFGPVGVAQPASDQLRGLTSPRYRSRWKAGAVVTISAALESPAGAPVPGWLAASLSAHCEVTIAAAGAQRLGRHCLRYDAAAGEFSYRWRLGTRRAGRVLLRAELWYPSISTAWRPFTVIRRAMAHRVQP
jgi:hypothetical protein